MDSHSIVIAALDGTDISREERDFFSKRPPAGFIFFKRNILEDSSNVLDLSISCQSFDSLKSIIAIDQEGGRVSRLSSVINQGPCLYLEDKRQDSASLDSIYNYGKTLGKELLDLGINLDFAPVLDIYQEGISEAIGDRCFSDSCQGVYLRAGAFYRGLSECIYGCLKHFPGLGSSKTDTHTDLTYIDKSYEELEKSDLGPYIRILTSMKVDFIMVSHAIYSKIDPLFPASSSSVIIKDILRSKLGFDGIVVSDDMLMKGCCNSQDLADWSQAIIGSVAAGIDLLLVCKGLDRYKIACEALDRESKKSKAFSSILQASIDRVNNFRKSMR